MLRPTPLALQRVMPFSLTREKNTRQVEAKQFRVLREFISRNLVYILNMDEEILGENSERMKAAIFLNSKRKLSLKRAYVLDFWKTDRLKILREIAESNEAQFIDLSYKIADWLRDSLFWPKTYLFVAQFKLKDLTGSIGFVGILLTKLLRGQLAEHPERILEQLDTGVIGTDIKKGHVFPHIAIKGNALATEEKVKSFEDHPNPAKYFYDFLHLDHPVHAQKAAEDIYAGLKKRNKLTTLEALKRSLSVDSDSIPELARATIEVDRVQVKTPIAMINNTVYFGKDGSRYVVLVKGTKAQFNLGKHDLVQDGLVQAKSTKEIAKQIEEEKSSG